MPRESPGGRFRVAREDGLLKLAVFSDVIATGSEMPGPAARQVSSGPQPVEGLEQNSVPAAV